jgi:spectinomycin phosphotransferase
MPAGMDGWAYRVDTADGRYFLKVKREFPGLPAVLVPRALRDAGITAVVAPIDTAAGRPAHEADGYVLLLYPYVDGGNLWDAGLTDDQWVEYGRILAAVHAADRPAAVDLPVESFRTTAPERIRSLAGDAARSPHLADLWAAHGDGILRLADETRELAERAAATGAPHVVCHTDIHAGNLLADPDGALYVVDWDAPVLAPRERDLMFAFGVAFGEQPMDPHRERLFRHGYGPVEPDPTLMAYYRSERTLDDIAQFTATVLDPDASEANRANELYWLRRSVE